MVWVWVRVWVRRRHLLVFVECELHGILVVQHHERPLPLLGELEEHGPARVETLDVRPAHLVGVRGAWIGGGRWRAVMVRGGARPRCVVGRGGEIRCAVYRTCLISTLRPWFCVNLCGWTGFRVEKNARASGRWTLRGSTWRAGVGYDV